MLMTLLHILLWLVLIVLGLVVLLGLILALVPLRVEIRRRIEGTCGKTAFSLISADYLGFVPKKICEI